MRHFFKQWFSTHKNFHTSPLFNRYFKKIKHLPVWSLDHASIARGVAAGLLVCFLPLPGQTLLAALVVCLLRGSLPAAILATWLSNPVTFIPINLLICAVGAWVLHTEAVLPQHLPDLDWTHESIIHFLCELYTWFASLSQAYLVGLPIISIVSALAGYIAVYIFSWIMSLWNKR
ncbi:MAG: DUF2062 domain-containing protein [Gammaproteobacteria bacterium]|nr:DUF2062 domain-containing protein [Gammaproteobacteria bacterium]MCD8542320.1 DUF2062 domain-containing protein [Gammaproteobacteria bacterium]